MTTVVEVHDLSKRFGAVRAVDSVSFRLEENRIYGLLGRNVAGEILESAQGKLPVFGDER